MKTTNTQGMTRQQQTFIEINRMLAEIKRSTNSFSRTIPTPPPTENQVIGERLANSILTQIRDINTNLKLEARTSFLSKLKSELENNQAQASE